MNATQQSASAAGMGSGDLATFCFLAIGLSCVAVAGPALANRIVIDRDWSDVAWSCAPVVFAGAGVPLRTMLWSQHQNGDMSPAGVAVLVLAGLGIGAALIVALTSAVLYNGIAAGLVVFIFKIVVALLISLLVLPQIFGRRDAQGRGLPPNWPLPAAVAGGACLLVNGDRVAARRAMQSSTRRLSAPIGGSR